jgi:Ca-activated chloride channel family protein
VFMNVQFNPAMVKQYRLIGFDNKKEALADNSRDLEGGEIGSGSSILAVFEIVPTQQNLLTQTTSVAEDMATLNIKYSHCNDSSSINNFYEVKNNFIHMDSLDQELKFATAVTMFALKLKQSKYVEKVEWTYIADFAKSAANTNNYLQNEFLNLIDKAQKLYDVKKKKKRKLF